MPGPLSKISALRRLPAQIRNVVAGDVRRNSENFAGVISVAAQSTASGLWNLLVSIALPGSEIATFSGYAGRAGT